jgi:hypothetical protein
MSQLTLAASPLRHWWIAQPKHALPLTIFSSESAQQSPRTHFNIAVRIVRIGRSVEAIGVVGRRLCRSSGREICPAFW